MSGLLRRLTRRGATADETPPEGSDPVAPSTASDAGGGTPVPADAPTTVAATGPDAGAAAVAPEPPRGRDLPAGVDPNELERAPLTSGRRSRLRRRLRYLLRVRELLLRDAGGFAYEVHRRNARGTAGGLLDAKLDRLTRLDAEVHGLEEALGQTRPEVVLHEPGVGGTCPACGEWYASDARFCSHCGTSLTATEAEPAAVTAAPETAPVAEPPRMGGLWRRRKAEPASGDPAVSAVEAFVKGGDVKRGDTAPGAGEVTAVLPTDEPAAPSEPAAVAHDTAEPDVAPPDTAEPDVGPRGAAEPDVAAHDAAEPDVAPRDTAEPDVAAHDKAEPDVAAHDTAEPDVGAREGAGDADERGAAREAQRAARRAARRKERARQGMTSGEPLGQQTDEIRVEDNGGLTSGDPPAGRREQQS